MRLPVHVQTREDGVRAFCPEIPGCSASARTEQEALRLLKNRVEECFTSSALVTARPGTRIIHIEV